MSLSSCPLRYVRSSLCHTGYPPHLNGACIPCCAHAGLTLLPGSRSTRLHPPPVPFTPPFFLAVGFLFFFFFFPSRSSALPTSTSTRAQGLNSLALFFWSPKLSSLYDCSPRSEARVTGHLTGSTNFLFLPPPPFCFAQPWR